MKEKNRYKATEELFAVVRWYGALCVLLVGLSALAPQAGIAWARDAMALLWAATAGADILVAVAVVWWLAGGR